MLNLLSGKRKPNIDKLVLRDILEEKFVGCLLVFRVDCKILEDIVMEVGRLLFPKFVYRFFALNCILSILEVSFGELVSVQGYAVAVFQFLDDV